MEYLQKDYFINLFAGYVKTGLKPGEVTEWLKVLAWKVSVLFKRVPRVRIPLSPQLRIII